MSSQQVQYLRISKDWSLIVAPRETPTFLANTTGSTIQILLDTAVIDEPQKLEKYALALGGTIPQVKVLPNEYLYARAMIVPSEDGSEDENDSATIIVSDDKTTSNTLNALREYIDDVGTQVMRLSTRVTDNEIALINRGINYELLLRKLLYIDMVRHESVAQLTNQLIRISTRLFSAESYIFKLRTEFPSVKLRVDSLENRMNSNEDSAVSKLKSQVAELFVQVDNIITKLNELVPKVEEGWGNYDKIITDEINPLKNDLSELTSSFNFLNNALVKFANTNTDDEINAAFAELLKQSSLEMEGPLTAMKNCILELKHSVLDTDTLLLDAEGLKQTWIESATPTT